MSSSIDRVRMHAAHAPEREPQKSEKTDPAGGDPHAVAFYHGKRFRKKRMGPPGKGRLPAKLSRRPNRTTSPSGAMAGSAPKHASASTARARANPHAWRDPYRQGGGNGRSGSQQDPNEDGSDDSSDNEDTRAGRFAAVKNPHQGATIALSDDVQAYAASVGKLSNRRALLCAYGVKRLNELLKEYASDKAQFKSHCLLMPLMEHQVFCLQRTPSQHIHALARRESQARASRTPSGRAVHDALHDQLAALACFDTAPRNDESIALEDIRHYLVKGIVLR
jgi:hypothetical protein